MKIFNLFILVMLLIPFCFASQSAVTKIPIAENVRELQNENANSEIQIEQKEQVFNLKKEAQLEISDGLIVLIKGFSLLLFDLIKLLVLYIEMRLFLFIFVDVIPKAFMSMSTSIAKGFQGSNK